MLQGMILSSENRLKSIHHEPFLMDIFGMRNRDAKFVGIIPMEQSRIDELMKTMIETLASKGPGDVIVIDSLPEGVYNENDI